MPLCIYVQKGLHVSKTIGGTLASLVVLGRGVGAGKIPTMI